MDGAPRCPFEADSIRALLYNRALPRWAAVSGIRRYRRQDRPQQLRRLRRQARNRRNLRRGACKLSCGGCGAADATKKCAAGAYCSNSSCCTGACVDQNADFATPLASMTAACAGARIVVACRPTGAATLRQRQRDGPQRERHRRVLQHFLLDGVCPRWRRREPEQLRRRLRAGRQAHVSIRATEISTTAIAAGTTTRAPITSACSSRARETSGLPGGEALDPSAFLRFVATRRASDRRPTRDQNRGGSKSEFRELRRRGAGRRSRGRGDRGRARGLRWSPGAPRKR